MGPESIKRYHSYRNTSTTGPRLTNPNFGETDPAIGPLQPSFWSRTYYNAIQ